MYRAPRGKSSLHLTYSTRTPGFVPRRRTSSWVPRYAHPSGARPLHCCIDTVPPLKGPRVRETVNGYLLYQSTRAGTVRYQVTKPISEDWFMISGQPTKREKQARFTNFKSNFLACKKKKRKKIDLSTLLSGAPTSQPADKVTQFVITIHDKESSFMQKII